MATLCAVTGASGFLASELIAQLLERGFTVRGTVRSLEDPRKTDHLTALPGAAERLTLFEADVLDGAAAFAPVFDGVSVVYHTACPFVSAVKSKALGEDYFVKPAVEGTLNVFRAAKAAGTVRRVVMTSSTAAIFKREVSPGHVYSERDWNDVAELRTRSMYYSIAKTLQEQAAWDFVAKESAKAEPTFDLVCINPTMIGGRMRQPGVNSSNEQLADFCNGSKTTLPNATFPWVHVKDVAEAHISAALTPAAGGERYMMIAWFGHQADMCECIARNFPGLAAGVPSVVEGDAGAPRVGPTPQDSSKVVRELMGGVALRGIEEIMVDSVASLIARGVLKQDEAGAAATAVTEK